MPVQSDLDHHRDDQPVALDLAERQTNADLHLDALVLAVRAPPWGIPRPRTAILAFDGSMV